MFVFSWENFPPGLGVFFWVFPSKLFAGKFFLGVFAKMRFNPTLPENINYCVFGNSSMISLRVSP